MKLPKFTRKQFTTSGANPTQVTMWLLKVGPLKVELTEFFGGAPGRWFGWQVLFNQPRDPFAP